MLKEKKIWKFKTYTDRAWHLSKDLARESVNLKGAGKGIEIVAHEMRLLTENLYTIYEDIINSGNYDVNQNDVEVLVRDFNALMLNGVIENMRLRKILHDKSDGYAVTVILDDLENLSYDILTLITDEELVISEQLEVKEYSKVTNEEIHLIKLSVGHYDFVENIDYIREIVTVDDCDLDGQFNLRGVQFPIIDLSKSLGQNYKTSVIGKTLVIIRTTYDQQSKEYAVIVDPFPRYSVYKSRYGTPVKCALEIDKKYVRESWSCHEDKQAVYLDWQAFDK